MACYTLQTGFIGASHDITDGVLQQKHGRLYTALNDWFLDQEECVCYHSKGYIETDKLSFELS